MTTTILRCSIVIILGLWTLQASPLSVAELKAKDSEETIRQAKSEEMHRYMNESADPCEDFFEFVCGNYGKYHPTNTSTSALDVLEEAMKAKLQKEMEVDDPADTDGDKKVKIFYRSCLRAPEVLSANRLKAVLKEFGQMPVLQGDSWQEDDFDWRRTVPEIFHKTGKSIIFQFTTYQDILNKSINVLDISQAQLVLKDRSFYVDETIPGEREKHKVKVAQNLHEFLGVDTELAEQTAKEILDFEADLARGMRDDKIENEESVLSRTIDELELEFLPVCNFKKFISEAMGLTPNHVLAQIPYLKNALEVLAKTPKKVVANYVFYTYITNYIFQLKDGTNKLEKYCTETTKELFYKSLMNLAYRRYFNEQTKEVIVSMWQGLKSTFENVLHSARLNWIQNDTLDHAVEKLKAMQLVILSYEQHNSTQELSTLDLDVQDYIHNVKAILSLRAEQFRTKFNEPPEPHTSTYFLPFYVFWENTVRIPLSVLQPNYAWSSSYPHAYNFASLGVILAHETLHGFDTYGRWFDADGSMRYWWDVLSTIDFLFRSICLRDQYKAYTFGGRPLDMEVQTENMADNGAVRLTYEAYLKWYAATLENERSKKDFESFPGLSYTSRQLFFISYGQGLCAATHPDYMAAHAAGDIHVPEKFRVIGSLSNFGEFSKEFNCPKGSGMNPVEKCEVY